MYYDELKDIIYDYIKSIKYMGYINVTNDPATKSIITNHRNNEDGICVLKSTFGDFNRHTRPDVRAYIKIHNIGDRHVISFILGHTVNATVDIPIVTADNMVRMTKIIKIKNRNNDK